MNNATNIAPGLAGNHRMIHAYGMTASYQPVSDADHYDFRSTYCMAAAKTFQPNNDLLTREELDELCTVLLEKGVRKQSADQRQAARAQKHIAI
ncbi:hypothetical protein HPDFL43_00006720 [Hoeflea phototrophica DFL-43]|uniref:Uncharacterized protein n=1 Tax=Hoeflea phototrophica (strain DSM 17068 / NCIMB 14078 / DFL-43) TaxID=411684 RepID=A0A095BE14_HOEPD|nr:hypothetical protein [Hoeflea phototrophica]KGB27078.1 hypothetical protein HPDFL43_00006720 [Hoeflea phototrophica DFL-43]